MENKDIKLKCIQSVSAFIVGNEYYADHRALINELDENDKQVIVIESTEGEMLNCYLIPLNEIYTYFEIIK